MKMIVDFSFFQLLIGVQVVDQGGKSGVEETLEALGGKRQTRLWKVKTCAEINSGVYNHSYA
ncbi:hypothetical protein [Falsibacillus albus]|uniref:hypothetical protein n=1 Tax=Falsibacillus albus TaxID=2478915 RepID=UPI0011E5E672|nr:hypothetical protein [Falsibacillus albus]